MRRLSSSSGLTIPEIVVVITVLGILMGILFTSLYDLYASNSNALKTVVTTGDMRTALRTIESELNTATSFHDTNTIADPTGSNNNPSSPTQWAWTGIEGDGTANRVIIASKYATTVLPSTDTSGNRTLVYQTDCETPILNNVVYFVKDETLYRRTLANGIARCAGYSMAQKTSCAANVSSGSCQGIDAKLLENVSDFSVDYYLNPHHSTPITDQYDPDNNTVPSTAQTISVTITAGVGNTEQTGSIRITRLNGAT